MTEEELRAVGRAEAEKRITAIMDAPVVSPAAESVGPSVGSTEWYAQRLAGRLIAQDARREAERRKNVPDTVVAEYDTEADERRRWALQQAARGEPAVRYGPAPGGEAALLPNGVMVLITRAKDGTIERLDPAVVSNELILPYQWEEYDRAWRARVWLAENELLSRHFSADLCVRGGLFTREEAAQLDPERSRHVTLPPGLEGM